MIQEDVYHIPPAEGATPPQILMRTCSLLQCNSHEVAVGMFVFLRHFYPKGRSQQVSESSSVTLVHCDVGQCCKVEKTANLERDKGTNVSLS